MTDAEPQLIPPEIPDERVTNMAALIAGHALADPDGIAVRDEAGALTRAAFADRVARIAGALAARGVGRGDCVATLAHNTADHVAIYCAILHAGACAVPLPWSGTEPALRMMRADCGARVLFASAAFADVAAGLGAQHLVAVEDLDPWIADAAPIAPAPVLPDDAFNMIYSSGTTGAPKGIVHSHRMRARQRARVAAYGLAPGAVALIATPLYSNTTLFLALPTLAVGATLICMGKFDAARYLALSQARKVTHAVLVPVQYRRLLDAPGFDDADLSACTCKFTTSAPLPAATKREVLDRWPGKLIELYGMTEGGISFMLDCGAHPDKLSTVGRPTPGSDMRVIDDAGNELPRTSYGEIVGRSGAMMTRYHNAPEKTAETIWTSPEGHHFVRSGDMGRFDADGFLHLLDRKKDMIISGGFNIYAADLEAVLLDHPDIADAAVIAIPSQAWGETPLGLVTLRAGATTGAEALTAWANARLGKTQRLSGVELRDALPRSEIGKILKRELRAPYWPAKAAPA